MGWENHLANDGVTLHGKWMVELNWQRVGLYRMEKGCGNIQYMANEKYNLIGKGLG